MTFPQNAAIVVEGLDFGFDPGHRILQDITLAVQCGERVAIMGPSGSGKTTLLKLMAGLRGYNAKAGKCVRSGRFVMLFQQPLLLDHMTVRDNIILPARLLKASQEIDQVIRILELVPLLDRYPFQLSGGQQRRVSLARALACPKSQGLLMDEPFTSLDEPLRERILIEVQSGLDTLGLTCIFSTHSPLEAVFLADRILFLGNRPATVLGEHVVRLRRGQRHRLLDKPEFFEETTLIRNMANDCYGDMNEGEIFVSTS